MGNEKSDVHDVARVPALIDVLNSVRCGVVELAEAAAWGIPTIEEAYRVQDGVAERQAWFLNGAPRFWKSGGGSRDAVLTHAPLAPSGVVSSPADMSGWPFSMRGIEAEVALRMGCSVDAERARSLDAQSAGALIDGMAVSIEIVDSRWREAMDTHAMLKLADFQSHGALVLGDWVPYQALDWSQQVCRVQIGQQPEVRRQGTHSLGDPAWLLPHWLRHATTRFGTVPAGAVVTTGTWVGILTSQAGDAVHVSFDGIGEAWIQL